MKDTTLDNPNITVKEERILDLDRIVEEVKQSEEWEDARMNIYQTGWQQGHKDGEELGEARNLIKTVESAMKNFGIDLQKACEGLGTTVEEYEAAKKKVVKR